MIAKKRFWHRLTPIQSLVAGFAVITLVFAAVFCLPLSSADGKPVSLIDSLFIAASGISTTGLCTIDIGYRMSLFGQIALMLLVQMGGIGYMVFILLIAFVLGHRPSLYTRVAFRESLAGISLADMKKMTIVVLVFTFIFEFLCAAILAIYWAGRYPISQAIYFGIFHSVSGFCTAGFGLLPDNMVSVAHSSIINIVVDLTCIAGAVGFFVLYNLYSTTNARFKEGRFKRLSLHSRLALLITLSLIVIGAMIVLFTENWQSSVAFGQKTLNAFFQAISASTTTGYNTMDIGSMSTASLLVLVILMFIGASPGSTGGGIKTTTFGILVLSIRSLFRGNPDINVFKKRISTETLYKSLTIGLIAVFLVAIDMLILSVTENASFLQIFFEIVSAFGNVGLSMGITPKLTVIGKLVLLITMFIGRVGPLAIGFSLIGKTRAPGYRYGEESVYVG